MSPESVYTPEGIASLISEVKQMCKAQGYFVGGRRVFGFGVVDGIKVPNGTEQALIAEMKAMREAGSSLLAVHRWLSKDKGVELAYSTLRTALARV